MSVKAVRLELPVEIHEYLTHVIKTYSASGLDPNEGMILFHLWDFVTRRGKVVELEAKEPFVPPQGPRPVSITGETPAIAPSGPASPEEFRS